MWILFLIIGLLVISVSFAVRCKYLKDLNKQEVLSAVVTESRKKVMEGGKVRYYPVLKFSCGGEEICREYGFGSKKPRYIDGQKVDILYDASNGIFYIVGDTIESRFFWGWLITGIIFVAAGAAWVLFFGR